MAQQSPYFEEQRFNQLWLNVLLYVILAVTLVIGIVLYVKVSQSPLDFLPLFLFF
jgi:hypothetical protein